MFGWYTSAMIYVRVQYVQWVHCTYGKAACAGAVRYGGGYASSEKFTEFPQNFSKGLPQSTLESLVRVRKGRVFRTYPAGKYPVIL